MANTKNDPPKPEETVPVQSPEEATDDAPIELLPEPSARPKPAEKLAEKPEGKPEGKSEDVSKPGEDKDGKQETTLAYQIRKEKERSAQLEADNKKYKQREEEERRAKMTAEQQRDEKIAELQERADRAERELKITHIGIDAKLPKSMWTRITGADEDAMRTDAEYLASIVKRNAAGSPTDPVREEAGKARRITRAELQASPKMAREAAAKLATGEWVLSG